MKSRNTVANGVEDDTLHRTEPSANTSLRPANVIRLLGLVAALLLSSPARAQWEGRFTGEITEVNDPQNRFQGVVQVGTPVSGAYTYALPSGYPGTLSCTLGAATLDSYDYWVVYTGNSDPGSGPDSFHLETLTLHPPEFQQPAPGFYNDGTLIVDLVDPTGTALSSWDLIDFPLGNSWLAGFSVAGGEFQLWETLDFSSWDMIATARYRITSYETSLPTPVLYPSPMFYSVGELDGSVTVTVKRVGDASGTATVDYATDDAGGATAGLDYTAVSGTLTFPPGVTSQSFTVPILDDSAREGYESFIIVFGNVTGADPLVAPANVSIADDELPLPTINVVLSPNALFEYSGSALVTVIREGDLSDPTTLDYGTADGTALTAEDYTATSGTLTFAPGEESKSFTVSLIQDSAVEGREAFYVVFSNISGALPVPSVAVVIHDPVPATVDLTFDPGVGANGLVYDLFPTHNGKILALGEFSSIGGVARKFLAQLNNDGTVDETFLVGRGQGDFDKLPHRLLQLPGGRLLLCGDFTAVGGEEQRYLARLRPDGSRDKSLKADINGPVWAMAWQPDGKILIAGQFTAINGVPRNGIARINAFGLVDSTFDPGSGPDQPSIALAVLPDGRILVGGGFENFAGVPRGYVARLESNGALDPTYSLAFTGQFDGPPSGVVTKFLVRPDGSHFVVGRGWSFAKVNGHESTHLWLINADGSVNTGFAAAGLNNGADAWNLNPNSVELLPNGGLVLGGAVQLDYDEFGLVSVAMLVLQPDGQRDPRFDPFNFPGGGFSPEELAIWDVAVQPDGKILCAGTFTQVSGIPRAGMARIILP